MTFIKLLNKSKLLFKKYFNKLSEIILIFQL